MTPTYTNLQESPHLKSQVLALLHDGWPEFMWQAKATLPDVDFFAIIEKYPEYQHILTLGSVVIATGHTTPVDWTGDDLPETGWDQAIIDGLNKTGPTRCVVGLAATICPGFRGKGLSRVVLTAMKQDSSLRYLFPVRPNKKHKKPLITMESYLVDTNRDDGLCEDPWVRTHQRLGGVIRGVCHDSMQLDAPMRSWLEWCGPHKDDGVLRDLLCPLEVRGEHGHYTEPNVWMEHL